MRGVVGKATAAAGTATAAARRGAATLISSTDASHSLADAFGMPIETELPSRVGGPMTIHDTKSGAMLHMAKGVQCTRR